MCLLLRGQYNCSCACDEMDIDPTRPDQLVALIADDEDIIRISLHRALESVGFFVLTACDGEQALRISRQYPGPIHILVSDIVMPKLGGVALCNQILLERPATKILLMSAYVSTPLNGTPFLRKPFQLDVFRRRVGEILDLKLLMQADGRA